MHTDFPCLNSILCPHKLSNSNTLAIFSCKKNCFPLILDQFELWVLCFNHVTVSISSLLLLLGPFKLYFVRVAILGPVHLTLGASGLQFNCCLRNANQLNIELVGVSCSFEVGFVCLCVFCSMCFEFMSLDAFLFPWIFLCLPFWWCANTFKEWVIGFEGYLTRGGRAKEWPVERFICRRNHWKNAKLSTKKEASVLFTC